MKRKILYIALLFALSVSAQDALLTGTPIGSSPSVDYSQSNYPATTTVNTPEYAFDGDLNTFYASYERSNTWVGLDLGTQYIITKVGWSPRNDGVGEGRVNGARFEGANNADFSDAVTLYTVTSNGTIGQISTAPVRCGTGFQYVRYVGPNNARCNVAEVQFYGHAGTDEDLPVYRPTNLPCVFIYTENNQEPYDKEHEIPCLVEIVDREGQVLRDSAGVRLRGNASMGFLKKPYRIKFHNKQTLLGSPAKEKKWTLINNYGDKTLMRNIVAFHISELLGMPYTPFCQAVDVVMNGDYKGCYQLCDQIEQGKNRVDVDKMDSTNISGEALTGGYLIEIDAYTNEEISWFYSNRGNPVTIKYPKDDEIMPEQAAYIRQVFNTMESAVYNHNNWRAYLDETTFLKHFIVGELSGNTDTYWSTYMYKYRNNDTLFTGPVWDFDIAFENDYRTYPINNKTDYIYRSGGSAAGSMNRFVDNIINDAATQVNLQYIWSYARQTTLTEEHLMAFIDSVAADLEQSQQLNFQRWGNLNQYVHMNPQVAGSYAGEVAVLKNFLRNRLIWLDNRIGRIEVAIPEPETNIENIYFGDAYMRIYNLQGVLVYEGVKMPSLPKGIYIKQQGNQVIKFAVW